MDTPVVTRDYCPVCEPEVDPLREMVVESRCAEHAPSIFGQDDARVLITPGWHGASVDVEGPENRARCNLIHRREEST